MCCLGQTTKVNLAGSILLHISESLHTRDSSDQFLIETSKQPHYCSSHNRLSETLTRKRVLTQRQDDCNYESRYKVWLMCTFKNVSRSARFDSHTVTCEFAFCRIKKGEICLMCCSSHFTVTQETSGLYWEYRKSLRVTVWCLCPDMPRAATCLVCLVWSRRSPLWQNGL